MDSPKEKLFEDEKLVIISSTREIDMTQWRNHLIKNWDKVGFLFRSMKHGSHRINRLGMFLQHHVRTSHRLELSKHLNGQLGPVLDRLLACKINSQES